MSEHDAYYGAIKYQAYLEHEATKAEIVYEVSRTYNRLIAEPGWADAAGAVGVAAAGAALLLAPAAATTTVVVGALLVAYGTVGATAYTLQALSRQLPAASGTYYSNAGAQFDTMVAHSLMLDDLSSQPKSMWGAIVEDHVHGFVTERTLRAFGTRAPSSRALGPDITVPLEQDAKRQMDAARRKADDNRKKTKPDKRILKPAAPPQPPPSPTQTLDLDKLGQKDPFNGANGTPFAGPDGPSNDVMHA